MLDSGCLHRVDNALREIERKRESVCDKKTVREKRHRHVHRVV